MHVLSLQHASVEHPGSLKRFLLEDGHRLTEVALDDGQSIPSLDDVDALWVMGGPMDVWQEAEHPWLAAEKACIREAVAERGLPFLGLCLGHQLLADALGGECGPSAEPEIGVLEVQLTEVGASGVILDDFPDRFPTLQWHSAEVTRLPEGATVLVTSPACAVQAMSWGTRAFSFQFHLEVEHDTVDNWLGITEYREALRKALGDDGPDTMAQAVQNALPRFETLAERLYINWLQCAART